MIAFLRRFILHIFAKFKPRKKYQKIIIKLSIYIQVGSQIKGNFMLIPKMQSILSSGAFNHDLS